MAINQITLAQLTNEAQAIGIALNQLLLQRGATWAQDVVNIGTTALQAAPYSLSSADATLLFNYAQDFINFGKVLQGLMYVAAGATLNSGVPTANDGTHFGYPFNINLNKCVGLGY